MQYVLDTDICIYIIKKRPPLVFKKFERLFPGQIFISSITWGELVYGAEKSQYRDQNHAALKNFIQPFTVLPFDRDAAFELGNIRAELEKKGQMIGIFDLMIAALARSLTYTIVTNNEREFRRVSNLQVENWAK